MYLDDVARWVTEPPKSHRRTPFERDRARIVHSAAMRRLGAKTQVLTPGVDDFVRTRLTHSLEVAQIGRELGRVLGCDPDVVDAACLAHDLGHPPFGHNGEAALAEAAAEIGGFEGNAQTLRLLTRLEPKVVGAGLNLTRATLDATVKYPWGAADNPAKFGFYADDVPVYAWLRAGAPAGQRSLEAQVMDLADDIAYSVHDVEDGVQAGSIDLARLDVDRVVEAAASWYATEAAGADIRAALLRLQAADLPSIAFDGSLRALAGLKDMTSSLISRLTTAAFDATCAEYGPGPHRRYEAQLVVPEAARAEIVALKAVAVAYVMAPRAADPQAAQQRTLLHELVARLVEAGPPALERPFADWHAQADDDASRLRVVIDQVASLTDLSAARWHARMGGECRA
ncbi:MAG: deoxyguanosinetriphosphate triphosphohydrolase [Promicromonosporaceae bacterium]|nr:deoxyguanosinetriphosphate triphosphohydrolase [Promicromonosporaceae bacterium]